MRRTIASVTNTSATYENNCNIMIKKFANFAIVIIFMLTFISCLQYKPVKWSKTEVYWAEVMLSLRKQQYLKLPKNDLAIIIRLFSSHAKWQ